MRLRTASAILLVCTSCQHAERQKEPATAAAVTSAKAAPAAGQPAISDFARFSSVVDAKISPGGTYLAVINTVGGKRSLSIEDLAARKMVSSFNPSPESVGNFFWANDSRVVVELLNESNGTLASPISNGELYAVNATGGRGDMIYGYRASVAQRPGPAGSEPLAENAGAEFLARLHGDDRHVMIESYNFHDAGDRAATLYRLDVYNGRKVQVAASPARGARFLTDEFGEPRIAFTEDMDTKPHYYYRDPTSSWNELANLKGFTNATVPWSFQAQARILDIVEPQQPKGFGLLSLNIDTGEKKLLVKNDWSGPSRTLRDVHGKPLAAMFEADVPNWEFLVPEHPLSRALKGLLDSYPDENVRILNTTDDEKRAVAYLYSDRDPGRFLLLDVNKLSVEEIASTRPWIKPEAGLEMTAFHVKASDGVWIHGYVTLPKSKPGLAPPMVVIPHGGPHGVRDRWGYNTEVQLLASQGFAVLQVNYRGSGGYGRKYLESGYTHWGDRIIQDIVDVTRYAVGKGYADPHRICAYGGSFGAYASLQSAIVAPDLFRCAVGLAGVYDLTLMTSTGDISESRLGLGYLKTVLGTDEAALKRGSPVYNADKLKAKVLLIHGKQDRRAPIEHAERMKKALEDAGAQPEWLVEQKEAHGFYDEGARERMYTRLVAFLQENTK